jgi:hypothetical protein
VETILSDCGVCLYSECDGISEFFDCEVRTARKPHRCIECGKQIQPQEKYEYARGKFDGDFWDAHTCLPCAEIADAFYCDSRVYGGGLWENMEYVMGELTTSCFDKLQTPEAKAELRKRWMEWKFQTVIK